MFALGRWRLAPVLDGTFALDGGAVFGAVPRPAWERALAPDARNRVRLALRGLLAVDDAANRRVLVDVGPGDAWDGDADRDRFALARDGGLDAALARHGVARADLTDVVLTHLHVDHAGGAVRRGARGLELAFPRAEIHLQRRAWAWAAAPSARDRGSFRHDSLEPLAHSGRLHLVDGACELFPDLELVVSDGHSPGQQLPRFHGGASHLTVCGDLVPTRAHLRPTWSFATDLHPLTALEEKKVLLAEALEDDGILFLSHDPEIAACRLVEAEGEPGFREAVSLE